MSKRTSKTNKEILANGEFYHVYNRGTDKRDVFNDTHDVLRFLQSMNEFNTVKPIGSIYLNSFEKTKLRRPTSKLERLVNIVAYCLNPNHYHFILEQCKDGGVSEFMKRLGGGYTKYFNHRYKRSGVLFQGKYKAIFIDSNEYLLYVSVYVNLNDKVHQLRRPTSKLAVRSVSSFNQYILDRVGKCFLEVQNKEIIVGQFKNKQDYADYAKETLSEILENKKNSKELQRMLIE